MPISILEQIKKNTDRTVLYAWDPCSLIDFSIIAPYFDKAFSFDLCDSMRHPNIKLLPNFYTEPQPQFNQRLVYSGMMIGAWRNDRIKFLYNLAKAFDQNNKSNYLFKVSHPNIPPLHKRVFKNYHLSRQLYNGKLNHFKLTAPIPPQEYMKIMEQSEIIVDDGRINQSGLTPRFIWALARNKKIITTNRYALQYNFVAPENICIVNREKPIIPIEFFKRAPVENPSNLSSLEIKNWIRIITGSTSLPNFKL